MNFEVFFDAFMYSAEKENVLRVSIINDDVLAYHLLFDSSESAQTFQTALNNVAKEIETLSFVQQEAYVKTFILDNPLNYEYRILSMNEYLELNG